MDACVNHPAREAAMRCCTCEQPICADCAHPTEVGVKCPACVEPPRPGETAPLLRPGDPYPPAFLMGTGAALALGIIAPGALLIGFAAMAVYCAASNIPGAAKHVGVGVGYLIALWALVIVPVLAKGGFGEGKALVQVAVHPVAALTAAAAAVGTWFIVYTPARLVADQLARSGRLAAGGLCFGLGVGCTVASLGGAALLLALAL